MVVQLSAYYDFKDNPSFFGVHRDNCMLGVLIFNSNKSIMNCKTFLKLSYLTFFILLTFGLVFPDITYSQASQRSLEENLARIDGDYNPSYSKIAKYSKELDSLENYCSDDREMISDMTVKAQQILKNREGIELTTLKLLNEFNDAIPEGAKPGEYGKCSSILASLMAIIVRNN
jgi:hypothetical protein